MAVPTNRLVDEVLDQLDNVKLLVRLFYGERLFTVYKSIAVASRLLFSGSSGEKGIVAGALPAALLPRLTVVPEVGVAEGHLSVPGDTVISHGGAHSGSLQVGRGARISKIIVDGGAIAKTSIGEMFDHASSPLPLTDWLTQPFLRSEWTLDEFIRNVANKDGGAHLDSNHARIKALEDWGYFHWHITAGIGRSLEPVVRQAIASAYPAHVRAIR